MNATQMPPPSSPSRNQKRLLAWGILASLVFLGLLTDGGSVLGFASGNGGQAVGCSGQAEVSLVDGYSNVGMALSTGGIGCFADDANDRDLPHFVGSATNMTPGVCVEECRAAGFPYAGVQYHNQCFCGLDFGKHGQVDGGQCNTPCDGNKAIACGGSNRNTIYEVEPRHAAPAGDSRYLGCFVDSEDRDLPHYAGSATNMTPGLCEQQCRAGDFRYAAVQNGNQCFCGHNYGKHGEVGIGECNMRCEGDQFAYCGAGYRSNVYALVDEGEDPSDAVGCFIDAEERALDGFVTTSPRNNKKECKALCLSEGFSYAGTQYGNQCFCGETPDAHGEAPEEECNMPCAGDADETCGGSYRNTVYKSADYVGCFVDAEARDLETLVADDPHMTPQMCVNACADAGFAYAGVQYGNQCRCGQVPGGYGKVDDSECDTPCGGDDQQKCGASWRNSVYLAAPYVGCFKDFEGTAAAAGRALAGDYTAADNMTIGRCIERCGDEGYPFAGLQYGTQCLCGVHPGRAGEAPEEECNMACGGSDDTSCGGFYRSSVYEVPGFGDDGWSQTFRFQNGTWFEVKTPDFDSISANDRGDVVGMYKGVPYAQAWGSWIGESWPQGDHAPAEVETANTRVAVMGHKLREWMWDAWQPVEGTEGWDVQDVSTSTGAAIWVVRTDGNVFERTGTGTWSHRGGGMVKVSQYAAESVWGIDTAGHLRRYTGAGWEDHGGDFIDVDVGDDNTIWRLTADGEAEYMSGTWGNWEWTNTGGHFTDLAVGYANDIWAVDRKPDPPPPPRPEGSHPVPTSALDDVEDIEEGCDMAGKCPSTHPVYLGGLCHKACPDGLTRTSIFTCESGVLETDCGKYASADSYDAHRSCPDGQEHFGATCHNPCPSGASRVGPFSCWKENFEAYAKWPWEGCDVNNGWVASPFSCHKGGLDVNPGLYGPAGFEQHSCPDGGDLHLGRCYKNECPAQGAGRTAICTCDSREGGLDFESYNSDPKLPDGFCIDAGTCDELFDLIPNIAEFDPDALSGAAQGYAIQAEFYIGVFQGLMCYLPNVIGDTIDNVENLDVPRYAEQCGPFETFALDPVRQKICDWGVHHASAVMESGQCLGQIFDALFFSDSQAGGSSQLEFRPEKLSRPAGNVIGGMLASSIADKYVVRHITSNHDRQKKILKVLKYLKRTEALVIEFESIPDSVLAAGQCL